MGRSPENTWHGLGGLSPEKTQTTPTGTTRTSQKTTTRTSLKDFGRRDVERHSFLRIARDNTMSTASIIPGSKPVMTPMLDLFKVPPTDFSIASRRKVPIHPFTTGITPVDFQIDPQSEYIDLSQSEFELELKLKKADGTALTAAATSTDLSGQQLCPLALQTDQRAIQQHAHQPPDGHVRLQGSDRHGIEF